jgi:glyoxylate reductase
VTRRPKVFVTDPMTALIEMSGRPLLEPLALQTDCEIWPGPGRPTRDDLRDAARDVDGLLCLLTDTVDSYSLKTASRLRVISSCSVGVDHIDVDAATARGIRVGHTPGVLTETTADLAFALLLAAARRIPEADAFVRAGEWTEARRWELDGLLGRDLHGATLGIVGLGAIGQAVARRASGFGMRVIGSSRSARSVPGVENATLERLLTESDFVSVHVPLTSETRHLIGASELARMKPGAILVNTARGGIVAEASLVAALRSGQLAAAALDVFEQEPLEPESPLRSMPNVVLAPHIGSASIATRVCMVELSVENLLAGVEGRPLPHCVNPAA